MEWTKNKDIGLADKCLFCKFCKLDNKEMKCKNKQSKKYDTIITNADVACEFWRYAL